MKKIAFPLLLALLAVLPISAQSLYNNTLNLSDVLLWQQGDSLYVRMKIDMQNLYVSPQRSLLLTPLLTDGTHNAALPDIMINGKRRQKAYIRGLSLEDRIPEGFVIPYEERGVLTYEEIIPYQPWMGNAAFNLVENLCGCNNDPEVLTQELITNDVSTEAKRLAAMTPVVAYIQPPVEMVKMRSEQYEAHLDFPVNKYVIQPEYMNNHKELANIQAMFDKVQNDPNLTVTQVDIEGWASPEGPLKFNEQLSQKRANALKNYLAKNEKVPANLYKVTFGGENWEGLVKALEASSMPDKETFINIIRNTTDDARRKQEIMRVGGGAPYRTMLKEIYPGLRKVNCKIEYSVINFDVEQGRIIIKTNPKYLSLNEMYRVANSYPAGSDDFVNVFDVAVRLYPEDAVANLNSAAVALSRKDMRTAMNFMEKANRQTAEYINNLGVYNFLNGNVEQATVDFTQAAQMGNEAAKNNLGQLQQIMSMRPW